MARSPAPQCAEPPHCRPGLRLSSAAARVALDKEAGRPPSPEDASHRRKQACRVGRGGVGQTRALRVVPPFQGDSCGCGTGRSAGLEVGPCGPHWDRARQEGSYRWGERSRCLRHTASDKGGCRAHPDRKAPRSPLSESCGPSAGSSRLSDGKAPACSTLSLPAPHGAQCRGGPVP